MVAADAMPPVLSPNAAAGRILARRHQIDFARYTHPAYIGGWFPEDLGRRLDRFKQQCLKRESPRLMLFGPPRHGKTEGASRRFPADMLGAWPDCEIIASSYALPLAKRNQRDVERIIESDKYKHIYPNTILPAPRIMNAERKVRQSDFFELINAVGSYRAAGVNGGITGMGANVGVIDDPVKGAREANSQTVRDSTWEWYLSDFRTRMHKGAGILLMMTRWNVDDLAGRLLTQMASGGEAWEVVKYQAIAEQDEEFRKAGEALHPERYDISDLLALKAAVGSYVWEALYQQNPTLRGGEIFKGEWWKFYEVLPRIKWRAIYVDTAQKTKTHNDYSVMACFGLGVDNRIYLLDLIRGKWEFPELKRRAIAFWSKWDVRGKDHESTRAMKIEDKVSGTSLIQDIASSGGIPVIGIPRNIDKVTRAGDGAPQIEAGNVILPDPEKLEVPWMNDFLMEFQAFRADDSHSFDDQIDVTLDAIEDMLSGSSDLYEGAIS